MNSESNQVGKMAEENTITSVPVFSPQDTEAKTGVDRTSFSCKKMISDTAKSMCCMLCYCSGENYCSDFPIINFSEYTVQECTNACEGESGYEQDDVRCCCFVFTPLS